MRTVLCVLSGIAVLLTGVSTMHAQEHTDRVLARIGFVIDGPWERAEEVRSLFEGELTDLLGGEFDVRFPTSARVEADWTLVGIQAAIDQLLEDPDVDLIITLGLIGSGNIARRGPLGKPAIAPFVLDAALEGIPQRNGASGVHNLSYVTHPELFARDIKVFLETVSFRRLAVILNARYHEAVPQLGERITEVLGALSLDVTLVPVDRIDEATLSLLPAETEAVYIIPLTHLEPGEFDRLVATLIDRRLPSFSLFGVEEVRRGVLMGLNPETWWLGVARRVALNAQRILLGEDASRIPVAFAREEQLTINMATARAIGVYPPWGVLTEATLINELRTGMERRVSLASVAQEAVAVNLDLAAQDRAVAAGAELVREARSALLPQTEIGGTATFIDKDRAEASVGSQAQRSLTGSATISQLLFSEPVWANLGIEGRLQEARVAERAVVELDIVLDAAVAYLNVLRGKTFERIQRENLRLTRSNRDLARVRVTVGTAQPGEIFRWENQLASGRRAVITSNARRNQAEIALNRVLHRPLEEPFDTEEADLEDAPLITGEPNILQYINNQQFFRVFRAFMVQEAFAASPELKQLDAVVAAQRRVLKSARNAFWAPTVAIQGGLTGLVAEGGAGTEFSSTLPPGTPDFSGLIPQANDLSWNIRLRISYPLFLGGARSAASAGAADALDRILLEREATAERVEQRVRSTLHDFGASYVSIELARDGARAARETLRLVTDTYSRGTASVVDLLDAQNAAVVAGLDAANAVYDFLIDMMEVERAVGRYSVLMSGEERNAFFQRLDAYFSEAGLGQGSP